MPKANGLTTSEFFDLHSFFQDALRLLSSRQWRANLQNKTAKDSPMEEWFRLETSTAAIHGRLDEKDKVVVGLVCKRGAMFVQGLSQLSMAFQ